MRLRRFDELETGPGCGDRRAVRRQQGDGLFPAVDAFRAPVAHQKHPDDDHRKNDQSAGGGDTHVERVQAPLLVNLRPVVHANLVVHRGWSARVTAGHESGDVAVAERRQR